MFTRGQGMDKIHKTFPAGLVIYWAWNNTLSIGQQWLIMKRHGAKIELWDNLRNMFKKKPKPAE